MTRRDAERERWLADTLWELANDALGRDVMDALLADHRRRCESWCVGYPCVRS